MNPAKLLHLDHRMGSIKVGKDADLVLWDGNPLSIYSTVLKTYIDGKCYYSKDENGKKLNEIKKERARIIEKMIGEEEGGGSTKKAPVKKKRQTVHECMDIEMHHLE